MNLTEMRTKRDAVLASAQELSVAHASDWSDSHQTSFDDMMKEYDALAVQVADAEKKQLAAQQAAQQALNARRQAAAASMGVAAPGQAGLSASDRLTAALDSQRATAAVQARQEPSWSLGEQLVAIAVAGMPQAGNYVDPRLLDGGPQGLATGSTGRNQTDGGFLVTKQQAAGLWQRTYDAGQALSRCTSIPISGDRDGLTMNALDESSRATGSRWGGVRVYRIGEGDTITHSRPKLRQIQLVLKDIAGAWYVTNSLLKDAAAMERIASESFTNEMAFTIENEIFNGTGGPQMLGINNSNARVSVTRSGSGLFAKADVDAMYSRLWSRSFNSSKTAWFIHQSVLPKLLALESSNGFPLYQPAGGMSAKPYGTLYGLPVIILEYMQSLGTVGDVMLADMAEYIVIDKGSVASDSSIHLRFLENESVFRWIARNDGMPAWNAPLTPANGSVTTSPFVVLAT